MTPYKLQRWRSHGKYSDRTLVNNQTYYRREIETTELALRAILSLPDLSQIPKG